MMAVTNTRVTEPAAIGRRSRRRTEPVSGFRPDIDGLRAVAIVLVVLYHAGVSGFAAGFIGVDIFFVISGFLIMTQLDRELGATGTLRLPTFWARRARRLIPAAAVTVMFVVVASQFVYSSFHWQTVATEALAATFYVSNELYRNASTDYFAPALTASPLLNTWSLAVEEQFYLVWPTLLVLVAKAVPVRGNGRRNRIVVVSVVTGLSFLFSQRLLSVDGATAYFSALSRAWEFGIGALLALLISHFRTWSRGRTRPLAVLSVILLGWAMLTITDLTPFPGWAAVLPVLAAAAIIVAGAGRDDVPARTLGCAPLQALGRLSYSWYLWHWPMMVLGSIWLQSETTTTRLGLVLIALVPAFLTYRYLELVLRRAPSLVRSNRRTAGVMIAFVLVVTSASAVLWVRGDIATADPYLQRLAAARADVQELKGECATDSVDDLLANCVWGDPHGSSTVLIIGDSHAAHWIPAFDEVGRTQGLRVVVSMQGSCPSFGDGFHGQRPTCTTKIAGTDAMITQLRPALTVFANSVGYLGSLIDRDGHLVPDDQEATTWQRGVEARADELKRLGVPMLIMLDTPRNQEDPIDCLAKTRDVTQCQSTTAQQEAILGDMHGAERAAVASAGWGSLFDALPYLCHDGICPLDDQGRLVYADQHHLTTAESRSLASPVGRAVAAALTGDGPRAP
jgi:peptidoglycan/LPS O-acetylase OafA/YrhL